ncbi:MAG: hypothetical protein WBW47_06220 [Thermoplasmata archaeon]
MDDSCYICGRTQVDLDRLNEEIRTKVYLSYFSNARSQIDEQRRRINFLQRLKDEESGDPHFRINARQVFGDPTAYKKLMPWIDQLMEIAKTGEKRAEDPRSMGELIEDLLAEERRITTKLEDGLNQIRGGFATGGKLPLTLERVTHRLPVEWSVDGAPIKWHASHAGDREPLQREPGASRASVEVPLHLCTLCEKILGSR